METRQAAGEGEERKEIGLVKHLRRAVMVFLVVKTMMGLQNVVFPKPVVEPVTVSHALETLYNLETETFSVLDRDNISFLLRPPTCPPNTHILLMALSAPGNKVNCNSTLKSRCKTQCDGRPSASSCGLDWGARRGCR